MYNEYRVLKKYIFVDYITKLCRYMQVLIYWYNEDQLFEFLKLLGIL